MTTVAYFSFSWDDTRLSWTSKPAYSSDIERIYSTESVLFTPSLVVENSINDLGVISDKTLPMRIDQSGQVTWSPGNIYETSCDIDTTLYPFDKQTCSITLTTRGYIKAEVELKLAKMPIVLTAYQENGEWEYISSSSDVSVTARDLLLYSTLTFTFTFQRRSSYHLISTIIPMFLLAFMSCYVFKLPVDAGEKLGYCLTVLLAFAVYLTLVSDNIPTTSTTISYLSVYLLLMLGMGVISVLLTIHIIDINFTSEEEEISGCMRKITKIISKLVCWKGCGTCCKGRNSSVSVINVKRINVHLGSKKVEGNMDDDVEDEDFSWQEIARILDIFMFRVYLFLVIMLSVAFIGFMSWGSLW
ncbi:neuronal acetylcholine receptor subunit alpha-3-like [Saccostrea cucullata]|uniref:neuronal acetylcholine receptor subunit alpha-3-like n=1 Tax=Saccostrea cuccullata TaxID=36930 RepID=UPI002ED06E29